MISYVRPSQSVWKVSLELVNKTSELLGKGRFASCFKAYLQGISVCIKVLDQIFPSIKSAVIKEPNFLSQIGHPAVCFLIGAQTQ